MKNPCEIISRHILPAFRSLIAKGLIEENGFTQVAAAEKLGTTQAAISYYLSSKRGEKYIKLLEDNPLVESKISGIIDGLTLGSFSTGEVIGTLCDLCTSLRGNDRVYRIQENVP